MNSFYATCIMHNVVSMVSKGFLPSVFVHLLVCQLSRTSKELRGAS